MSKQNVNQTMVEKDLQKVTTKQRIVKVLVKVLIYGFLISSSL